MTTYRQGDVLIMAVATRPETTGDPLPLEDGGTGYTLAHGEATGHRHFLAGPDVRLWNVSGGHAPGTVRFCQVGGGGAVVRHEEHGPIELPAGSFVIKRQREYSPEAIRTVAD